ncbi:hypothetical protein M0805_000817 [Coniferiporia weirii]|nr:hypothetical protein M0805_000817 [Coniferiporia weirii]
MLQWEGQVLGSIPVKARIRLSWNVWPSLQIEATHTVVRTAALYSDLPPVLYEPMACKSPCRTILNPYCQIDICGKLWISPFCLQRNAFPPHYKDISNTSLLAELLLKYTMIEYTLTCLTQEDLKALHSVLAAAVGMLPPDALVGLIIFGTMTQVHELGYAACTKAYMLCDSKDYSPRQIQDMLSLSLQNCAMPRLDRRSP